MVRRLRVDPELYQAWWTGPNDGCDRFRELFTEASPAGKFIQKMAQRVARDNGYDLDEWDHEMIEESVWDQLEDRMKSLEVTDQEHREWLAKTKVKV